MKQYVTKAIVLRRTNFAEADRIITVLTPEQGKLRLVAKGVRRIKSRLAGGIELMAINDLTYIQGRGDLGTLVSARLVQNFGHIVHDVHRTMYAYEVLKLIDSATEDSPEAAYFHMLHACLGAIDDISISLDWVRVWLYLQLLIHNGHEPNLTTDSNGKPLNSEKKFTFSFESMAFVEQSAGMFDAQAIKVLRLAKRSASPALLAKIQNVERLQASLAQLTKTMYLDYSHRS